LKKVGRKPFGTLILKVSPLGVIVYMPLSIIDFFSLSLKTVSAIVPITFSLCDFVLFRQLFA
jgi:hypothetical protein